MTSPTVYVTADVMTHESMRFALKEIVRRERTEPFGAFTAKEAAAIAAASLEFVEESEKTHA